MRALAGLTWFLIFLTAQAGANTVTLATFHSPPYQIALESNGPVSGHTVKTVECVLDAMEWQGNYLTLPPGRALHALRNNGVDGYFAVDPSLELDNFASPTAPFALEQWYFLSLNPFDTLDGKRIGAVRNGNEAAWLKRQDYEDLLTVSSPEQLIPLLRRGRVDAILKDWQFLEHRNDGEAIPESQRVGDLHRHFVRYAPLHLYMSNDFIALNPSFIERFNRHIPSCATPAFSLDGHERVTLKKRARKAIRDLKNRMDLISTATLLPPYRRFSQLIQADRRWRQRASKAAPKLAEQLLGRADSVTLAQWQAIQNEEITETFVVDWEGSITALSRVTSDLWQGDEPKFQALLPAAPGDIILESLAYDASTRRFQVMVSTPLYSEAGDFMGGLMFGLDVEQVLRHAAEESRGTGPQPEPAGAPGRIPDMEPNR